MKNIRFRVGVLISIITLLLCGCAPSFPTEEIKRYAADPDVFTIPQEYTVSRLCEESDVILLGKVVQCEEGNVATEDSKASPNVVTVKVEQPLLGNVQTGDHVQIADSGYSFEEEGTPKEITAFGAALLQKGYRVVLFLQEDPEHERYALTQYELGKYVIDEDDLAYPAMYFSTMFAEGKTWAPTMETMEPIPLDTLLSQINSAVQ